VREEPDAVWWGAWVAEDSGPDTEIGRIQAPARWGLLGPWSVMWTEYYGPMPSRCDAFPYSRVVFSSPSADGGTVAPVRSEDRLGDGDCDTSRVTRTATGARHEMGLGRSPSSDE
jgi:hypothetical protein